MTQLSTPIVLLPPIHGSISLFNKQVESGFLPLKIPPMEISVAAKVLLQQIHEPKFAIFGASYGGLLGWHMSLLAPNRVCALITFGTLPSRFFLTADLQRTLQLVQWMPNKVFRSLYRMHFIRQLLGEGVSLNDALWISKDIPEHKLWCRRITSIYRCFPEVPPSVPHYWMLPSYDPYVRWSMHDVREALPSAKVGVVDGGHFGFYTHSMQINQKILDFCSKDENNVDS